jgi:hypothetical protein
MVGGGPRSREIWIRRVHMGGRQAGPLSVPSCREQAWAMRVAEARWAGAREGIGLAREVAAQRRYRVPFFFYFFLFCFSYFLCLFSWLQTKF